MITRFKKLPDARSIQDYKTIFTTWKLILEDLTNCGKLEPRNTERLFEGAEILTDHVCKIPNAKEDDLKIDFVYMKACSHYGIKYESGNYNNMMYQLINVRYQEERK